MLDATQSLGAVLNTASREKETESSLCGQKYCMACYFHIIISSLYGNVSLLGLGFCVYNCFLFLNRNKSVTKVSHGVSKVPP